VKVSVIPIMAAADAYPLTLYRNTECGAAIMKRRLSAMDRLS